MTDIRKADPIVRRRAVVLLLVGMCAGALLIVGFERYRIPLRDWVLSDPETSAQWLKLIFLLVSALLLTPLVVFAAYVWSLGKRVLQAREFPPPGLRVIRDTPVVTGERAISLGRLLKVLALGCGIASVALGFLFWRLAVLFP
jgi:hypothetical protein